MGMEISETGRQGQRSETRGNRDRWRGVRDVTEIEQDWDGEGVAEKGWGGTDFVRDPSAIQYLTTATFGFNYGFNLSRHAFYQSLTHLWLYFTLFLLYSLPKFQNSLRGILYSANFLFK